MSKKYIKRGVTYSSDSSPAEPLVLNTPGYYRKLPTNLAKETYPEIYDQLNATEEREVFVFCAPNGKALTFSGAKDGQLKVTGEQIEIFRENGMSSVTDRH